MGRPVIRRKAALALTLLLWPAAAWAQSGIAGVVKDTSGAVLPGVTVEASSPVLIEKVRTVVTDNQGQYKIVDLRPGVYAVTFSLSGFNTVKHDGIELTTNFTAPVNAELTVGALVEEVTVSGRSPVVDVQNVSQQRVVTSDVIAALPTARSVASLAAVIPGISAAGGALGAGQDVGGSAGEVSAAQRLAIHGGRATDMQNMLDGMPLNNMNGASLSGIFIDMGAAQEMNYQLGVVSAETTTGGVHADVIPKQGGNKFSGTFFGAFTNHSLQRANATSALVARGLGAVNHLDKLWDLNPSFGGPIKQNKLWVFGSFRYWGTNNQVAGMWANKTPSTFVYTPDLTRQAVSDSWLTAESVRFTWQVTPKHKVSVYQLQEGRCLCHAGVSGTVAPEAATRQKSVVAHIEQVIWTAPLTSRLLIEAGVLLHRFQQDVDPQPEVAPDTMSVTELSTTLVYRAPSGGQSRGEHWVNNYKGAITYVTGSHSAKVGFTLQNGKQRNSSRYPGDMTLQLLNGLPRAVVVYATPFQYQMNLNAALGVYAQDQWTVKRLTLNGGLRWDHHNASDAEIHLPAAQFIGARDFAAVTDAPNWNDLSPRLGASYDIFGNGKTALKVTLSRYVLAETLDFAQRNNPIFTSVNSATRTWGDDNGDFIPQASELGALSNTSFGKTAITTRYDDAVRSGFGSRGYNWEASASLQHELMPRVSASAAYFRRSYGNFLATDNLAVTPADYDTYCVTAPVDARLPGGGGNQVCGLYDLNPAKFGQVNNRVTFASNFGKQTEVYNGIDLTLSARLPRRSVLAGGVNTGRTATNNCFVVDSPQQMRFCDVETPFLTQVRFLASVGLPWELQASGTFQSLPGPQMTAAWVVPNALIKPSLLRDLAAGPNGNATVELVPPGTRYDTRLYQVDLRLTKIIRIGRARVQGNLDLYNALNSSPVLAVNNQYGSNWQRPTDVLPGRLFKFGAQVDF